MKKKLRKIIEEIFFRLLLVFAFIYYKKWSLSKFLLQKTRNIKSVFWESLFWFGGFMYVAGWFLFVYLRREINRPIFNFFWGEKIYLNNVIILTTIQEKRLEFLNEGMFFADSSFVIDDYVEILDGTNKYLVFVPSKKNIFFPGMKINILCRKYLYDKEVLYFQKFLS